ncbi:major facilitator superfamily permease [Buttiauxella brennerae ATCC 51605]|uniref:Major facilitator superfamily permease n=1 Tax=Buttiauxella brennerae ATCC 51605 TaxID=1354251 RepID=A0A1B7IQD2_9ENTR|nr:MFS transporter [Buttiauxella brennerae]OAT31953.1 major facilitator superfamily permease [Buttiauxella brennerae ATCC 51605]
MQIDLQSSVIKRINKRIIPFLMLLYLIAYIDRSNISVAALQMNADLALTAEMYGIAAGVFYIAYIIFEVPSNIILTRVGAKLWIARIMVTWGIIAAGMSLVQTPTQLYVMRFLLGVAEAGFTPGIIYYLSCWYPRSDRARAMSMFYIGAALASVIGLPISGTILNMHGFFDIAGWRWLFLLEGIPAIAMGVVVWFYLDDSPAKAQWLSASERDWLQQKLVGESSELEHSGSHQWHKALTDKKVWLLSAIWLLQAFGTIGITLFLPLIVKGVVSEQSNFIVSVLSAVPFLFACIFMFVNGRHSDLTCERRYHLGVPLIAAGILLMLAILSDNLLLAYILLVITVALNWAVTPIFWAATTESLTGVVAAAAIALINAVANIAGLIFPPLMGRIKDVTGSYDISLAIVASALIMGGLLGFYVLTSPRTAKQLC